MSDYIDPFAKEDALKKSAIEASIGALGTLTDITSDAIDEAQSDYSEFESERLGAANYTFNNSSFDAIGESFYNVPWLTSLTKKDVSLSASDKAGSMLKSILSGAGAGASVGGVFGTVGAGIGAVAGTVLGAGIKGIGLGVRNAKDKKFVKEENPIRDAINARNQNQAAYAANTVRAKLASNALLNQSAYGGPLFNFSEDFSNGITFINAGGTHEENPLGGVPVGVDQNGTPNLVEEGEVIWKDYVFSNRLKPTKKQLEEAGYTKYQDLTFAEIAERLQDSERPNDKISKDSLIDSMSLLMSMQETVREKKYKKQNKFDTGGPLYQNEVIQQLAKDLELYRKQNGLTVYNELEDEARALAEEETWAAMAELQAYRSLQESIKNRKNNPSLTEKESNTSSENINVDDVIEDEFTISPAIVKGKKTRTVKGVPIDTSAKIQKDEIERVKKQVKEEVKEEIKEEKKDKTVSRSSIRPENGGESGIGSLELLRYSPIIANSAALLSNAIKKPDYRYARNIERMANSMTRGSYDPIGNYLNITTVNPNTYLNPYFASSRSTARTIQNQGLNAPQTIGLLLANEYNTQRNLGTLMSQIEDANLNKMIQKESFNRGTNQSNSEMGLRALSLDQAADQFRYNAMVQGNQLRAAEDAARQAAINSNIENITDSLAGIGDESYWASVIKENPFINPVYKGMLPGVRKNGGCLTRRRRRR